MDEAVRRGMKLLDALDAHSAWAEQDPDDPHETPQMRIARRNAEQMEKFERNAMGADIRG